MPIECGDDNDQKAIAEAERLVKPRMSVAGGRSDVARAWLELRLLAKKKHSGLPPAHMDSSGILR